MTALQLELNNDVIPTMLHTNCLFTGLILLAHIPQASTGKKKTVNAPEDGYLLLVLFRIILN